MRQKPSLTRLRAGSSNSSIQDAEETQPLLHGTRKTMNKPTIPARAFAPVVCPSCHHFWTTGIGFSLHQIPGMKRQGTRRQYSTQ